ncbi:MAG: hypothetical protein WCT48_01720 [Candidatus Paceibacterota bacterium]
MDIGTLASNLSVYSILYRDTHRISWNKNIGIITTKKYEYRACFYWNCALFRFVVSHVFTCLNFSPSFARGFVYLSIVVLLLTCPAVAFSEGGY